MGWVYFRKMFGSNVKLSGLKDFSLVCYKQFLQTLKASDYTVLSLVEFIERERNIDKNERLIILRHDIDRNPKRALSIAEIEREFDFRSSYYINSRNALNHSKTIKEIISLGHELGYHYSDLTDSKGNVEKAYISFKKNLTILRQFYDIKTISMDGKPLSPYHNLDLWKSYNYRDNAILTEFYQDLDYSLFAYYTDTGRRWNNDSINIRDKTNTKKNWPTYNSSFEIIKAIKNNSFPTRVVINIHPEHWTKNVLSWYLKLIWQMFKNIFKYFLRKL
jgi:hypothetical protein